MIEKLTPEQLKAAFDLSDASDVTDEDRRVICKFAGVWPGATDIRLLKHYHPELFVDPRLEAAKKLAREILAEEYEKGGWDLDAKLVRNGQNGSYTVINTITRALLMDPPTVDGDDA